MEPWQIALLLKPALLMLGAVVYYFMVILGLRWLYPRLPKSRLVDALFRERANRRPDYGPGAQRRPSTSVRGLLTGRDRGGGGAGPAGQT